MKRLIRHLIFCVLDFVICLTYFCVPVNASSGVTMWRLYNPYSGEHFYTANEQERDHLYDVGWNIEGVGWTAPEMGDGKPVYRLYNRYAGDHHYTMKASERDFLVSKGWKDEGIGWYSDGNVKMHREYNPNAYAHNHNYTADENEHQNLIRAGWKDEGTCWNAYFGGSNEGRRIHPKKAQTQPKPQPAASQGRYNGPFIVTPSGSKYHRPDCPTIRRSKKKITIATREEARAKGYKPCSDCKPDE